VEEEMKMKWNKKRQNRWEVQEGKGWRGIEGDEERKDERRGREGGKKEKKKDERKCGEKEWKWWSEEQ
jgi:hypothetical protein